MRKVLAYGGRTLSSVITLTGSSQALQANPIAGAIGQDCSGCTLNSDNTLSASAVVLSFTAWWSRGPPALGPFGAGSAPHASGPAAEVCSSRAPPGTRPPSLPTAQHDACWCCVTLTLAPSPTAGAPGKKRGAQCEVHVSTGPRQQGSAYLLLHSLLSQHQQLSTPGRRGAPCPGNGWGNSRA